MANYHNKKETKKVGLRIQSLRLSKELTIEDVASMTGFDRKTIKSVEAGNNADTSHLIEIAKAIGVHPKELFDVPMEIKPRYKLSPRRLANNKLTNQVTKLALESNFFDKPKFVKDVLAYLFEEFNLKAESVHVSVILKRISDGGQLKFTKVGRSNYYSRR